MPLPILAALGAASIPVAGSLGAAAMQRKWALKDWDRINAYNHPGQQIKRLKEAGLPLASMFSGSGGSTSSDIRQSEVDPSLGTASGVDRYFSTRLQQQQLELMKAQTYKATAEAQEATGRVKYLTMPMYDKYGFLQIGNRQTLGLDADLKAKQANAKTQEILSNYTEDMTKGQILHTTKTNARLQQQFDSEQMFQKFYKYIDDNWKSGNWSAFEALINRFFLDRFIKR